MPNSAYSSLLFDKLSKISPIFVYIFLFFALRKQVWVTNLDSRSCLERDLCYHS